MIQWWQILLLTLYAGFQIMDELHWYSSAGSRRVLRFHHGPHHGRHGNWSFHRW